MRWHKALPPKQFRQILESAKDGRLTLESTKTGILVTREHGGNEWGLDTLRPDEFPIVDGFAESAFHKIPAKVLGEMIQRTIFATDCESTRFALAHVCFECDSETITAIATDGRRLATQDANATCINGHQFEPAIVPVNTLKLLSKVLKEKSASDANDVMMAVNADVGQDGRTSGNVLFHCGDVTVFSRLVDGRFPKWRSIMPTTGDRLHAKVICDSLRTALVQMVTTKLEPGVTFSFNRGKLTLESRAKEAGQSKVVIAVAFDGAAEFIIDAAFLRDYLRVLDADTTIDVYMTEDSDPVLFETHGSYRYLVMPMSSARSATKTSAESETAEPEADTGIEAVGQVSTEEETMKDNDFPHTDDAELETRLFELQSENEQLHAKVERYKVLLDRAMVVIERLKCDPRVCV